MRQQESTIVSKGAARSARLNPGLMYPEPSLSERRARAARVLFATLQTTVDIMRQDARSVNEACATADIAAMRSTIYSAREHVAARTIDYHRVTSGDRAGATSALKENMEHQWYVEREAQFHQALSNLLNKCDEVLQANDGIHALRFHTKTIYGCLKEAEKRAIHVLMCVSGFSRNHA